MKKSELNVKMKQSAIFGRLFLPNAIRIDARRLKGNRWRVHYSEEINLKDSKTREQVFANTIAAAESIGFKLKVSRSRNGNRLSYVAEGSIDVLAGTIIGEFLVVSRIGDVTLRDFILGTAMSRWRG